MQIENCPNGDISGGLPISPNMTFDDMSDTKSKLSTHKEMATINEIESIYEAKNSVCVNSRTITTRSIKVARTVQDIDQYCLDAEDDQHVIRKYASHDNDVKRMYHRAYLKQSFKVIATIHTILYQFYFIARHK